MSALSSPDIPAADLVDLNDSDDENTSADGTETPTTTLNASECIQKAQASKEAGNDAFTKQKNLELARKHYAEGVEALKEYKAFDTLTHLTEPEKVEIKSLLISLHGNRAMIWLKEENWNATIMSAGLVLDLDGNNVKARYRRGVAHSKSGNLDKAKEDLSHCLELEPSNALAKKELALVAKLQKEMLKKEKAAYSSMFAGKSVYEDKEKERAQKAHREEMARLQEQDDFTQAKLSRRSRGLEEQSFEEWKKERDEERERKKKEQEEAQKAKEKAEKAAVQEKEATLPQQAAASTKPTSTSRESPKANGDDDEDLYDEEDAKIIAQTTSKGYCYFRNTLNEEVKSLIGDITPKTVTSSDVSETGGVITSDAASSSTATVSDSSNTASDTTQSNSAEAGIAASSWNKAGTWEERDTTSHVKGRIEAFCLNTPPVAHQPFSSSDSSGAGGTDAMQELLAGLGGLGGGMGADAAAATAGDSMQTLEKLTALMSTVNAKVTGVKSVEGDAQIVMARGKKRRLYEMTVTVQFEAVIEPMSDIPAGASAGDSSDKPKKTKYKGTFVFTDLGPDSINEPECSIQWGGKKGGAGAPSAAHDSKVKSAAQELRKAVEKQLQAFHAEYVTM